MRRLLFGVVFSCLATTAAQAKQIILPTTDRAELDQDLRDLGAGSARIRKRAIACLMSHPFHSVPALARVLGDEDAPAVSKREAARLLWRLGAVSGGAVPALAQALADEQVEVRRFAARTLDLCALNGAGAVPALTAALRDDDPFVRLLAVRALGAIGAEARSALRPLMALSWNETRLRPEIELAIESIALEMQRKGLQADLWTLLAIWRAELLAVLLIASSVFLLARGRWSQGSGRKLAQTSLPVLFVLALVALLLSDARAALLPRWILPQRLVVAGSAALLTLAAVLIVGSALDWRRAWRETSTATPDANGAVA